MKILLFILLLLLFIPIPIKISISYSKGNYYIKLYKFYILKSKTIDSPSLKAEKHKKKPKQKKKLNNKYKPKFKDILEILKSLKRNKFKPKLKINGKLDYSTGDAKNTAISYGIINGVYPPILELIKILFSIKKVNINVNPIFKDEIIVNFELISIIYTSIVKTIYMGITVAKCYLTIKSKGVRSYDK